MRVGDSFIADVNRFAAAVIYAVDNGALVIQSALGTLNNSSLARDAVDYAYEHGVTVDRLGRRRGRPAQQLAVPAARRSSSTRSRAAARRRRACRRPVLPRRSTAAPTSTPRSRSRSRRRAAPRTPSASAPGLAGVLISAALNAHERGRARPASRPACGPCDGDGDRRSIPASITPERGPPADGVGHGRRRRDARRRRLRLARSGHGPSRRASPAPGRPAARDPVRAAGTAAGRWSTPTAASSRSVAAAAAQLSGARRPRPVLRLRPGEHQPQRAPALLDDPTPAPAFESRIPPEVEIESPNWNEQLDPAQASFDVTRRRRRARRVSSPARSSSPRATTRTTTLAADRRLRAGRCRPAAPATGRPTAPAAIDGKLAEVDVADAAGAVPAGHRLHRARAAADRRQRQRPAELRDPRLRRQGRRPTPAGRRAAGDDRRGPARRLPAPRRGPCSTASRARSSAAARRVVGPAPTGDGESSPAFADLDGDNRNELIFAGSDGFVHAMRPDGTELPGWPVRGDVPGFVAGHAGTRAFETGEVVDRPRRRDARRRSRSATPTATACPRSTSPTSRARSTAGAPTGERDLHRGVEHRLLRQAADAVRERPLEPGQQQFRRTQHGFLGSPVLADLDARRRRLEIVAAAMDRHVYAWDTDDSARRAGRRGSARRLPGARRRSGQGRVRSTRPRTRSPSSADAGLRAAGSDRRHARRRRHRRRRRRAATTSCPRSSSAPTRSTRETDCNAGDESATPTARTRSSQSGLLEPGQRAPLRARRPRGDTRRRPAARRRDPARRLAVQARDRADRPAAGRRRGRHGQPDDRPGRLRRRATTRGPNVGAARQQRPRLHPQPGRQLLLRRRRQGARQRAAVRDRRRRRAGRPPVLPAVGHPAFGDAAGRASPSFVARRRASCARSTSCCPSTSRRARTSSPPGTSSDAGSSRPGFPATVNDLQFLTGPSIADIDGLPGRGDHRGHARARTWSRSAPPASPADPAGRRLTTDWTVANPLIGSFGTLDTEAGATQGRGRRDPLGLPQRLRDRRRRRARRPPGRASTTTTPTPATTAATRSCRAGRSTPRSSGTTLTLQRAGRRPALRHGRPLRDRHLGRTRSTRPTSTRRRRSPARPTPAAPGAAQTYAIPADGAALRRASAPSTSRATSAVRPSSTSGRRRPRRPARPARRRPTGRPAPVARRSQARHRATAPTRSPAPPTRTRLAGTAGADRIRGRGGDDRLNGRGRRRLRLGPGRRGPRRGRLGRRPAQGRPRPRPALRRLRRRHDPRPPRRP